jgi:hypothetical protein
VRAIRCRIQANRLDPAGHYACVLTGGQMRRLGYPTSATLLNLD